jgi:hypothetical protein
MDRHMAQALDNHITGHGGEDQFKDDPYHKYKNHDLNWKVGDRWQHGPDVYLLTMTNARKNPDILHFQFVNIVSGNRWSEYVVVRDRKKMKDCTTLLIAEVSYLLYGRDVASSVTDEDNQILDDMESNHLYGGNWE